MEVVNLKISRENLEKQEDAELENLVIGHTSHMFNSLIRHIELLKSKRDFISHKKAENLLALLWKCKGLSQDLYWDSWELKNSVNKYYTDEYREMRKLIFSKYSNCCMKCGEIKKLQIDHIKPVSKHPNLFLSADNMQVLCENCNKEKSNKNENDYRGL